MCTTQCNLLSYVILDSWVEFGLITKPFKCIFSYLVKIREFRNCIAIVQCPITVKWLQILGHNSNGLDSYAAFQDTQSALTGRVSVLSGWYTVEHSTCLNSSASKRSKSSAIFTSQSLTVSLCCLVLSRVGLLRLNQNGEVAGCKSPTVSYKQVAEGSCRIMQVTFDWFGWYNPMQHVSFCTFQSNGGSDTRPRTHWMMPLIAREFKQCVTSNPSMHYTAACYCNSLFLNICTCFLNTEHFNCVHMMHFTPKMHNQILIDYKLVLPIIIKKNHIISISQLWCVSLLVGIIFTKPMKFIMMWHLLRYQTNKSRDKICRPGHLCSTTVPLCCVSHIPPINIWLIKKPAASCNLDTALSIFFFLPLWVWTVQTSSVGWSRPTSTWAWLWRECLPCWRLPVWSQFQSLRTPKSLATSALSP